MSLILAVTWIWAVSRITRDLALTSALVINLGNLGRNHCHGGVSGRKVLGTSSGEGVNMLCGEALLARLLLLNRFRQRYSGSVCTTPYLMGPRALQPQVFFSQVLAYGVLRGELVRRRWLFSALRGFVV